ncbi:hypothetical protein PR048_008241 [Dryococelus australis]|uniref:Aberrant panicle organization 1 protein n=1 Tax=Dryococelus australis TaxID=614101 RepID=A0ABQ9HWJ8_9NEOP|nr:hypothetical protein PR048_008241 [Dryococelus australis]
MFRQVSCSLGHSQEFCACGMGYIAVSRLNKSFRRKQHCLLPNTEFLIVAPSILHFDAQVLGCLSGSNPSWVAPGFSHVGVVPDDAAGRRVFSEFSRFPCPWIPALLYTPPRFTLIGSQDLDVKSFPNLFARPRFDPGGSCGPPTTSQTTAGSDNTALAKAPSASLPRSSFFADLTHTVGLTARGRGFAWVSPPVQAADVVRGGRLFVYDWKNARVFIVAPSSVPAVSFHARPFSLNGRLKNNAGSRNERVFFFTPPPFPLVKPSLFPLCACRTRRLCLAPSKSGVLSPGVDVFGQ